MRRSKVSTQPKPTVLGKKNFHAYLRSSSILIVGVGATLVIILGKTNNAWEVFASLVGAVFAFSLSLKELTQQITISKEQLMSRSIYGRKSFSLKSVKGIEIISNIYGGYVLNIVQSTHGKTRKAALTLTAFSNARDLSKAAIEAAQFANPRVKLNLLAREIAQQPPHNILGDNPNLAEISTADRPSPSHRQRTRQYWLENERKSDQE